MFRYSCLRELNLEGNQLGAMPVGALYLNIKYLRINNNFTHPLLWRETATNQPQVRRMAKAACKRTQQLPTLLAQQCWELLRTCWQWCANGCKNSQQCWDLQCIVGRIQPISLCKPCVMSVRGPNNVERAVQTDPTLLRYASAITEQKKCWELLAEKFDRFQTLRNNTQQHPTTCNRVCKRTQHVTSNNAGSCWPTMLRPFARGLKFLE